MIKGRWAFLPLLQDNYIPKKQLKTRTGQSKIDLSIKHILQIAENFKNKEILLTCDSWFGVKALVDGIRAVTENSIHVLSRLRINSSLYELPKGKKTGRGRRPKYGRRIESVSTLAKALKASAKSANIFMYSNNRDILYSETILMSKALRRKIKVIFVYSKTALSFRFLQLIWS